MGRKAVVTIVLLLALLAGVGGYLAVYRPSQQPILTAAKPIPEDKQDMMPATPLGEVPEPERTRYADALREAVHAIEPGYRIDEERMYLNPGGWDPLSKLSGEYLSDDFGYRQDADTDTEVHGQKVDYLVWRARTWWRGKFDDRVVVAVQYTESVDSGVRRRPLGYFVLRPVS